MSELPRIAPTPVIRPVQPARETGRRPRRKREPEQEPDDSGSEHEGPESDTPDDAANDSPTKGGGINLRV